MDVHSVLLFVCLGEERGGGYIHTYIHIDRRIDGCTDVHTEVCTDIHTEGQNEYPYVMR
jgi:hypothetical protein